LTKTTAGEGLPAAAVKVDISSGVTLDRSLLVSHIGAAAVLL
jgi:hypothetical protein